MTISLGGVTLNNNLIWDNRDSCPLNAFSRRVTISGRVVLQHSSIDGREIILTTVSTSGGTIGYFEYSQLESIRSFENNMSVISFVYETETLNVIVEPGGINVEPVVSSPIYSSGAWFLGSIKLIEVNS